VASSGARGATRGFFLGNLGGEGFQGWPLA
jgi:hypothetical protein